MSLCQVQGWLPTKQFPLSVSPSSRQSDICFHDCIVCFLMATRPTLQMNGRWNGESSRIMWPTALRVVTAVLTEAQQTYGAKEKMKQMHIEESFKGSAQWSRPVFNKCVIGLVSSAVVLYVWFLWIYPCHYSVFSNTSVSSSQVGSFYMWSQKNILLKITPASFCFAQPPWTPRPPQMWVWTHKDCFLHCRPYAH